jgi:hypothetical protein
VEAKAAAINLLIWIPFSIVRDLFGAHDPHSAHLGTSFVIFALAARESEVKIYAIRNIRTNVAAKPQLGQSA